MSRRKQGRDHAPATLTAPSQPSPDGRGRDQAEPKTGGRSIGALSAGLLTGGRAVVLAAVVAGTGTFTLAQAVGEPGPEVAGAETTEVEARPETSNAEPAAGATRGQGPASRSQLAGRLALETAATRTFTVTVDGESQELTTGQTRLSEALAEADIVVGAQDRVSTGLGEPVVPGMTVEIERVRTERVSERTVDEHDVIEKEDDTLLEGRREVETEGVDGVSSKVYDVTRAGEEEISRELVASVVASEKVDEVVRVGTKKPVVTAAPSSRSSSSGSSSSTSSSGSSASTSSSTSSGASSGGSSSSGAAGAPSAPPAYSGDARALGRDMAAARGWGAAQFQCLDSLWTRESNWNHRAMNPSSGAYGIPQSLPGSKMASAGSDWRTNPATQISWGLNYIAGRYGTPCAAWSHSEAVNWY